MTVPVPLDQLLANLPDADARDSTNRLVTGVHHDSRKIRPGDIFVAIRGTNFDGRDFIPQALERGAAAVVLEGAGGGRHSSVPWVRVSDARAALAHLAAAFYAHPSHHMTVVGVTGTDGKTTTCHLIHGLLTAAGHCAGMVSTVGALSGNQGGAEIDTGFHVTTPEAQDVQRYLRAMVDGGAEYAVIEATSHGLDQRRLDAVAIDVAVLTNVTHESLEYHGTFEAYRSAKVRLFRMLSESPRKPGVPKTAIINADDPSCEHFAALPADRRLTYGVAAAADVTAADLQASPHGLSFTAHTPIGPIEVHSPLLGRYNVYNLLAALAVGVSQDLSVAALAEGVARVGRVRGRMDLVDEGQDFVALVDFAHTPAALESALIAARELTSGRVIVVFGAAGLRDAAKRSVMGGIAARLAEIVVITAEDPRTEDLTAIMDQIAGGVRRAGSQEIVTPSADVDRGFLRIPDRGEAIRGAAEMARPGDVLVVCGKGHEASMCFGATEYPWSDHLALRMALRGDVHRGLPTADARRPATQTAEGRG
jgi:UDP-N-acetylmuramoyl-L-alanyl-D-glutamate--2,6-diaminopimelate ligase